MSKRELGRVGVLARVKSKDLRVVDAAALMRLSYRQAKRLWKRYREEGAAGLKHRSAGRRSKRAYAEKFRRQVLGLVREKYGGAVGGAVWAHPGGGAPGLRGWAAHRWRDATAVDAGGRAVEPGAEAKAASEPPRTQGASGGDGPDGRKFSPLAGRAGSGRMLDGLGG